MKIFGIGFHKTGTKSLATALKMFGYRVVGPVGIRNPNIANEVLNIAFELADKDYNDAFQDNPWAVIYKELDERYPGSKFILTVRATDQWIGSAVRHFADNDTAMREWIYGVGHPLGNEEIFIERYERHNREVQEYFKDRPDDFVVLNFPEDGWEKICKLLGKPIPKKPFPHVNKAEDREKGPSAYARAKKKILWVAADLTRPIRRKLGIAKR